MKYKSQIPPLHHRVSMSGAEVKAAIREYLIEAGHLLPETGVRIFFSDSSTGTAEAASISWETE